MSPVLSFTHSIPLGEKIEKPEDDPVACHVNGRRLLRCYLLTHLYILSRLVGLSLTNTSFPRARLLPLRFSYLIAENDPSGTLAPLAAQVMQMSSEGSNLNHRDQMSPAMARSRSNARLVRQGIRFSIAGVSQLDAFLESQDLLLHHLLLRGLGRVVSMHATSPVPIDTAGSGRLGESLGRIGMSTYQIT